MRKIVLHNPMERGKRKFLLQHFINGREEKNPHQLSQGEGEEKRKKKGGEG